MLSFARIVSNQFIHVLWVADGLDVVDASTSAQELLGGEKLLLRGRHRVVIDEKQLYRLEVRTIVCKIKDFPLGRDLSFRGQQTPCSPLAVSSRGKNRTRDVTTQGPPTRVGPPVADHAALSTIWAQGCIVLSLSGKRVRATERQVPIDLDKSVILDENPDLVSRWWPW